MPKKIFILEDDQDIREIMEMILSAEGFDVFGFATIKEFNQANLDTSPDIYLLDVMLPDGNGIDVCSKLKAQLDKSLIPVLMMSAHVDVQHMQESCGAQGYLEKPFDIYGLIDQIRLFLN